MRLWHVVLAVAGVALILASSRDPITRAMMIVLIIGIGEVVFGLMAVMALFQTIGALGEARGVVAHAEALMATTLVLGVATAIMVGWLYVGVSMIWDYV